METEKRAVRAERERARREEQRGRGGKWRRGELDGVPTSVEDGGVVGDEDVDAVDVAVAGGDAVRDPGR